MPPTRFNGVVLGYRGNLAFALMPYEVIVPIFSLLSLILKNENRLMRSSCSLCVYESPPIHFWMPEPIFMKFSLYVMTPEPVSTANFINLSVYMSACVCLLSLLGKRSVNCVPSFIARQRHGKHVPVATNMRSSRIIVGPMCLWLCIPFSLLGNKLVKTFSLQRRIVGSVVFCAVRCRIKGK
jgi:hypothetical protein